MRVDHVSTTAQAVMDAQIGGLRFAEDFSRVRDSLEIIDDELEAVSEVEYLEGVQDA